MSGNAGAAPKRAMILAAGLGTRMRPVTDRLPKPLIAVHGRALIDHALDRLLDVGVETVVVNTHYMADKIEAHLKTRARPKIAFSPEPELLDTGGGVRNALPMLDGDPFYAVNADAFWLNGPSDALKRMADTWRDDRMDGLLLLHSTVDAYGYIGVGDFLATDEGLLTRRPEVEVSPWLFTGIQILHPRLFDGAPDSAFSLNVLFDRAIAGRRLYGVVHDGEWFHVGNQAGLDAAESFMQIRFPDAKKRR
ncbi:MAG TPA: nucleotidyltransferase family protein [Rhodospirillales bacterium]